MSDEAPTHRPDLRLVCAALAAWGTLVAALHLATVAVAALLCGVILGGVGCLLLGRRHDWLHAVALALFATAVVLAPLSVRLHHTRDGDLAVLARAHASVTADLVVVADPRPLASVGVDGSARSAVDARLTGVRIAGRPVPVSGSVLVLGPSTGWRDVLPGQRVRLDARLQPPLPGGLLAAVLSERTDPHLIGRPPWYQRGAGTVRAGLRRASAGLPPSVRGLLPGIVDGDTADLDPVLAQRFRVAGLTHLVAVSGTNCSILVGTVLFVLRRFGSSPRVTLILGLVTVAVFVVVARPSASVVRAAVMAAIALVALAKGRQRDGPPALAAAVLILLVWRSELATDIGFLLSVAATGSLMLIAPGWVAALRTRHCPAVLAESVGVAAAAHVVTAPIVVGISGRLSLVAIPANVLAEPVVAAATVLGALAAGLSLVCLPVAAGFAQLAGWPCRWLVWVAEHFGSLPGAALPWPSGVPGALSLSAVTAAVALAVRRPGIRVSAAVVTGLALLVQIPVRTVVSGWPPPGWSMVVCDVGQGDGIVLNAGGGQAVEIDAGPDPVAIDRCLHDLGISRIPLLVLTHFHLDHVGGLSGVLHGRAVGQALVSPLAEPVSGDRLVQQDLDRAGVPVQRATVGSTITVGQVRLQVLGPVVGYHNTRSDPNNSSVILRAVVGATAILLPGDAEVEAQDDLLATHPDLSADILKVPHHGSAYSDPAFLQAVHARFAAISVGAGNDYGHPSPLLMEQMAALGVPTYRTDQLGDIAFAGAGTSLHALARASDASGTG